jgi:hypothetical protein
MSTDLCRILSVEWLSTNEFRRGVAEVVHVNVNTADWSIPHDENADGQTKTRVPESSLTKAFVGSVVHNSYI